jgi:hypothetical protein
MLVVCGTIKNKQPGKALVRQINKWVHVENSNKPI